MSSLRLLERIVEKFVVTSYQTIMEKLLREKMKKKMQDEDECFIGSQRLVEKYSSRKHSKGEIGRSSKLHNMIV